MTARARRFLLAALAAALLAFGGPAAFAGPFVDAAGRTVELPDRIGRVVAAGPPAATLLYTLAPEALLGWVRAPTAEEKAFLAPPFADLPAIGRLTGKGGTANVEAILALRPDVIVDIGSVDPTYASLAERLQAQTGIPTILVDGTLASAPATYRTLGRLLGREAEAEELAAYAESALAEARRLKAAVPAGGGPRVYYGRGPDGLETGLAGSINVELIEAVGARNVAAAAGSGGLATVSPEQVLAWNPDVILTQDRRFFESVGRDPRWRGIAAVENGRVFLAPSLPFGWFDSPPGVNRLIGLRWLAAVLHPEAAAADLAAATRDFYARFYHVDLGDEALAGMLRDATRRE